MEIHINLLTTVHRAHGFVTLFLGTWKDQMKGPGSAFSFFLGAWRMVFSGPALSTLALLVDS